MTITLKIFNKFLYYVCNQNIDIMKNFVKEAIIGLLGWACIIWMVGFDPAQIWSWFKVAICLVSVTVFFWWIFDFRNPFADDEDENEII